MKAYRVRTGLYEQTIEADKFNQVSSFVEFYVRDTTNSPHCVALVCLNAGDSVVEIRPATPCPDCGQAPGERGGDAATKQ